MSDIHISPWLIPTPFVLMAVLVLSLSGCGAKTEAPVARPIAVPTKVEVAIDHGLNDHVMVSEFCYDGVVYLMNSRGGMAPKMDLGSPNNATACK